MDEFNLHWDGHPDEVTVGQLNNIAGKFPGGYERQLCEEVGALDHPHAKRYKGRTDFSAYFLSLTRRKFYQLIDELSAMEGWPPDLIVQTSNILALPPEQQQIIVQTYRRLRAIGFNHYELIA